MTDRTNKPTTTTTTTVRDDARDHSVTDGRNGTPGAVNDSHAVNERDIVKTPEGEVLVDGKTSDGRRYHKQVWLETKSPLTVLWDGLRYTIPAGKTKVEAGAFTSHLGGKSDAALSHVIAQQAFKQYGTVSIDGKLVSLCHITVDKAAILSKDDKPVARVETVDGLQPKKRLLDPTNPLPAAVETHITIPAVFDSVKPPLVAKPAPKVSGSPQHPATPIVSKTATEAAVAAKAAKDAADKADRDEI